MNRSILFATILTLFSVNALAASFDYGCVETGGTLDSFKLTVMINDGRVSYLVNDSEPGEIDYDYKPTNPYYETWRRLSGYFESIGDGAEGFNVTLLVNRYLSVDRLIENSKFGLLEYRADGPEGYYSIEFKCTKL